MKKEYHDLPFHFQFRLGETYVGFIRKAGLYEECQRKFIEIKNDGLDFVEERLDQVLLIFYSRAYKILSQSRPS